LALPLVLTLLLGAALLEAADPAAAERQYRIARRLVAEGSSEARAALEKVIELDPVGSLADDATVEKALLLGVPRWPEELGRIEIREAQEALELVSWVAKELSGSDRALEARHLRALLLLEPLPFHDASEARLDLITVATANNEADWSRAARYATGWLAEQQAKNDRALAAYQRLVVDAPGSEAAAKARVGIARLMLRLGRFGPAADNLQQAIDSGAPPDTGALALRELAVRSLLGRNPGATGGSVARLSGGGSTIRSPACYAATPGGGLLLGDQKKNELLLLDDRGMIQVRWSLAETQAVAVSPTGRVFAAAGEALYRLEEGRQPLKIASLGDMAPVSALAVDGAGQIWLLDRRGERLGRLVQGGAVPIAAGAGEERSRLTGLAWDGRRMISIDQRQKRLVAIGPEGSRSTLAARGLQKPVDVAANPAGGIAVLDSRADAVFFFDSEAAGTGSLAWSVAGLSRVAALDYAPDGALILLDGASGASVRVP
jgi:hypothetical protein